MKYTVLVSANPNPDSLTVHVAQLCYDVLQKHSKPVTYIYLDEIQYNPLVSQQEIYRRMTFDEATVRHQQILRSASTLMLFFPDWFGFPPALLVGWLQRVFAPGIAFEYAGKEFELKEKRGLLSQLTVIVVMSTDEHQTSNKVADAVSLLQKRLLLHCNVSDVQSLVLYDTHNLKRKQKRKWIDHCVNVCLANA